MNLQTKAKDIFLNSLNESQRNFFLANEHRNNIDDLLEYKITYTQYQLYQLYQVWRDEAAKKGHIKSQAKVVPEYPEFLDAIDFDKGKAETVKIIIRSGRYGVLDKFFADQSKYQQEYLNWKQAYLAQEETLNKVESNEAPIVSLSKEDVSTANKENKPVRRARSTKRKPLKVLATKETLAAVKNTPASQQEHNIKISTFLTATDVSIKMNNTVKDNDDSFVALQINLMGQKEWNRRFPKNTIVIYTDGSCFGSASSGAGIYHGQLHDLNRAYNLSDCEHNSGFAEIGAVVLALNDLKAWKDYKNQKVVIRTDFLPMVQAMQNKSSLANSRFPALYDVLRESCAVFVNGVEFQHVYAHDSSDTDPGNAAADEFARQAAACGYIGKKNKSRGKSVAKDRSQVRGRAASKSNCVQHIRSHSAYILADHIRPPLRM